MQKFGKATWLWNQDNEIRLQIIQYLSVKAAVTESCNKILNKLGKINQDQSKELLSPFIDGLVFLGKP